MAFYLRRTKKVIWNGAEPDEQQTEAAVESFARTEADTDGISVFVAASEADRLLIVAAIACSRSQDSPIDLLEIPDELVRSYGEVEQTLGETPVASVNLMHRSLNWTPETLRRLALEMLDRRAVARRFTPPEVRAAVAGLSVDDITEGDARAFAEAIRGRHAKLKK